MNPHPTALSLWVCEHVLVDDRTNNPSLINVFTGLPVDSFPSAPQRFSVCATMTGGVGGGRMELRAFRLSTSEQIYGQGGIVRFADRTDTINLFFHVRRIAFPGPGYYLFRLFADNVPVRGTRRTVRIYRR